MAGFNARTLIIWIFAVIIIVGLAISFAKINSISNATDIQYEYEDAPAATAGDPLTLSSNEIVISRGDNRIIGISIYNPTDIKIDDATLIIECNDPSITVETFDIDSINANSNIFTKAIIKIGKRTTQDTHICSVSTNVLKSKSTDLLIRVI